MRIISGKFRGRKLLPPAGHATRPITDRAKQSLFDILAPLLPGSCVYDCFAGTGSMGLECLSRGADLVAFFESHRDAISRLRRNIEAMDVGEWCKVVPTDLFKWFAGADAPPFAGRKVDLIFLDPPYRYVTDRATDLQRFCQTLAEKHLAPDATVVFRHQSGDELELELLRRYDRRTYGGMTIDLLRIAT